MSEILVFPAYLELYNSSFDTSFAFMAWWIIYAGTKLFSKVSFS